MPKIRFLKSSDSLGNHRFLKELWWKLRDTTPYIAFKITYALCPSVDILNLRKHLSRPFSYLVKNVSDKITTIQLLPVTKWPQHEVWTGRGINWGVVTVLENHCVLPNITKGCRTDIKAQKCFLGLFRCLCWNRKVS